MKTEKGSTILLVLVIIVVITTLGMVLGSMTLSTRLQFNKTDRLNVATDLAEMGITYIDKKIDQITFAANKVAKEKTLAYINDNNIPEKMKTEQNIDDFYSDAFCMQLTSTDLNQIYEKTFEIEQDRKFELKRISDPIKNTDCRYNSEIPLKFISKGTDQVDSKSIEVIVYLNKSKSSGSGHYKPGDLPPPKGDFTESNGVDLSKIKQLTIHNSTYFNGDVVLSQGHDRLTIEGNAYFAKEVDLNGNSTLIIYGDAFFTNKINEDQKDKATSYNLCVKGSIFFVENGKLITYTVDPKHLNPIACPFPIDDSEYDFDLNWTSEEKEIDVTY